jgi:hypothetical protein
MVEEAQSPEDVRLFVSLCYGSGDDFWFRLDSDGYLAILCNLE